MQPLKAPRRVARISSGGAQLLVGPASSFVREQMKVRSSTRATSDGWDRTRKQFGRFSWLSGMNDPVATA